MLLLGNRIICCWSDYCQLAATAALTVIVFIITVRWLVLLAVT